jgi:hypothetical protein
MIITLHSHFQHRRSNFRELKSAVEINITCSPLLTLNLAPPSTPSICLCYHAALIARERQDRITPVTQLCFEAGFDVNSVLHHFWNIPTIALQSVGYTCM